MVGFYFDYPQLGFTLGALAGSALFPTQLPAGPRISDNRTTTSVVGGPVPIVFGTANVAGTVIWLAPIVGHSNEQGGKGGPVQQTFSYTQSIAIGLCERVDDDAPDDQGAIQGISRIWENGAIVYDIRPQLAANSDEGSIAETDDAYADRLTASAAYASTFVLYLGDELQTADPTIEAIQGVGNVPGYRGLAYIVYPNRALQIAQGLRHPNFQFEVYQSGTGECADSTIYSNDVLHDWSEGLDPTNPANVNTYKVLFVDADASPGAPPGYSSIVYNDVGTALSAVQTYYGHSMSEYLTYGATPYTDATDLQTNVVASGGPTAPDDVPRSLSVQLHYNQAQPTFGSQFYYPGFTIFTGGLNPHGVPGALWWQQTGLWFTTSVSDSDVSAFPPWDPPYTHGSRGGGFWFEQLDDAILLLIRAPSAPLDPCALLPPSLIPGYCIRGDGKLVKGGAWTKDTTHTFTVLQTFSTITGGGNGAVDPLSPCLIAGDPNDNETFWTAAYSAAVGQGTMLAGMTYSAGGGAGHYPQTQDYAWAIDQQVCTGGGGAAVVSDIIRAICKRSGLTAIDVDDMADVTVDGYAIASVCTGSAVLTPLRSVAFFDAVETDGVLKFAARGKPIVATLTSDDIGAYDAANGASTTVPPSMTVARAQDPDLPRSIRFHYIATARDYEDGEQPSPFRLTTKATNDIDVTVPICLGDVQAAKCASVNWADAWASRNAYSTAVDQSWLALDVGDCIAVPVDGFIQRLRIASDQNASAVLRKLSLVGDDSGAYISFAVASVPQRVPQVLTFVPATDCFLLDLPCLADADSDPGFYVAGRRAPSGGAGWKGFALFKSIDGGTTFTSAVSITTEATAGTIEAAVPVSEPYTWDDVTEIIVNVASSAITFESRTDEAVLAGANAAAMGSDRAWEIVQFGQATQLSATRWKLTRLLRGRRGTEHVMGSSQAGDDFVMISTGDLGRVILQTTEIGASRIYKAVSLGTPFASGLDQTFSGHAQALVPFSPVDLRAAALTDGDILITWIRRSRLGRTLMSGVDIPLGEASLAFQVDILEEGSPFAVKRTLAVTATQALYTAAQQVADFGSGSLTSVRVAIYQLSAIVGRGTPAIETLTLT